jgi:hypothetical protein
MIEVGCWMHARRYVYKALESDQRMGPELHLIARVCGGGWRQGAGAFRGAKTWPCASAFRRGCRSDTQQQTQVLFSQLDRGKRTELRLEDGSQGFNTTRSEFGRPLLVLIGIVALVWLAACANLANLQLARSQERTQEFVKHPASCAAISGDGCGPGRAPHSG